MATGTASTSALRGGVPMGCGTVCSPTLPTMRTWNTGCWTVPSSARMRVLPGLKKNGGAAEQALGRSRGGFSTKLHLLVDGLGNVLRVHLTGGQCHDSPHAA